MDAFEKAVREVAEAGALSFSARRELWLAFGPWEERDEMDKSPRTLTEPLRKRAELALACAKKVGKVWSAYDGEDKGPQELLKKANAYLKGKLEADQLYQAWKASDYMRRAEDERYSSAPMAAIAAERAAVVPYYDEFLLEPRYAGADDSELDPYDWDAAWCAALAWSGRDENAGGGQQKVEEMKFWAWYLEQAAQLLEIEGFKFPKKAIKDFEEKQELSRPVPEEVTLETFTQFMGVGEYRFYIHTLSSRQGPHLGYEIHSMRQEREGICPKCGTRVTQAEFWYSVNCLDDTMPQSGIPIRLIETLPMFHCPNHPDTSFTSKTEYVNPKAALKRYLEGPGRQQALLEQLKSRRADIFQIGEGYVALNGYIEYHHNVVIQPRMKGIRWLNQETEELEIDLTQFGPHVYFPNLTFDEFREAYPEQVETLENGCIQITMERHWVRCWLDEAGNLERVVVQSRFHLEVSKEKPLPLTRFLMMEFHLSRAQAEAEVEESPRRSMKSGGPFSNLSRGEAMRLCAALRCKEIKCRIMPVPVGEKGDTQLR